MYTLENSRKPKLILWQKSQMINFIYRLRESMLSPETRERELRPLQMIPDNYEKNCSVHGSKLYYFL